MQSFCFLLIILGFLLLIYNQISNQIERYQLLNKYKIVLELMNNFQESTYQIIYNEQLLVYTSQGTTSVQKDQLETIERNFIKLTLELMGTRNEKLLVSFFGNRQVLIANIVLYFRHRLEQDEISK